MKYLICAVQEKKSKERFREFRKEEIQILKYYV
jgi:hypothetical protein